MTKAAAPPTQFQIGLVIFIQRRDQNKDGLEQWSSDTSVGMMTDLEVMHYYYYTPLEFTTDWERRIKTLIRNLLLLQNPQFLPKNYGTS